MGTTCKTGCEVAMAVLMAPKSRREPLQIVCVSKVIIWLVRTRLDVYR